MAVGATYQIVLDEWSPGLSVDPDYDITEYVTSIQFSYGMNAPYLDFAPPSRAFLVLADKNGDFNPDDTNAKYYSKMRRGQIVRIYMDNDLIYTAKLVNRDYSRENYVTLTFEDQMLRLLNTNITPKLQTNVTVDEVIKSVFEQQVALWRYDFKYFRIGYSKLGDVTGALQQDQGNILFGPGVEGSSGAYTNLLTETGRTTLIYAGDVTLAETSAQTYLREIVATEAGGMFFWDAPYEAFRFLNRWAKTVNWSQKAYFDGTVFHEALWEMDDELVNDVTVNYRPRAVSDSVTVLYESPNTITLKSGATLEITASYQDPANPGATCGGFDMVATIGTDIIVNTEQDGSGSNVTATQRVEVEFNATSAKVTIENLTANDLYVTKLQVRGKPISLLAQESEQYQNIQSMRDYDRYPETINIPALGDPDTALAIARIEVLYKSTPIRKYKRLSFWANQNSTTLGYAKDLRVGDGVRVEYDDHAMNYVIIGFEHSIQPGGKRAHQVSMWLESVDTGSFFTLGRSKLNRNDVLAF